MLLVDSAKSKNMKYLGLQNSFSNMGYVHNDLNFDVANVLVESLQTMKSQVYNYVEVARSQ